jgi:hypothetical protein
MDLPQESRLRPSSSSEASGTELRLVGLWAAEQVSMLIPQHQAEFWTMLEPGWVIVVPVNLQIYKLKTHKSLKEKSTDSFGAHQHYLR